MSVDAILNGSHGALRSETPTSATCRPACSSFLLSQLEKLSPGQLVELMKKGLELLEPQTLADVLLEGALNLAHAKYVEHIILPIYSGLPEVAKTATLDKMFSNLATHAGISTNLSDYVSLSIAAMNILRKAKKPNLVYKWAKCIVGENGNPFMALDRMPFGLVEYQIEFFTATNVMQVC